ncbi:nicotinate phosphoribosyltransferase [Pumilibacter muris]|uniref:nicotinate phosphoribosyltransferase n=1 Tax=Pumilibacter muris TaxID=2941510 RepID=UPI002041E444|nr:nicotinate phosphoribosyltransferase [Pumilibacter muris]
MTTETRNLTMMTDLYQLTMMNGYFLDGSYKNEAVFDLFFRANGQLNYAIAAGLEQAVDYIKNLRFDKADLEYLSGLGIFAPEFIEYLRGFKFTGDIFSVEEGEVVFPGEPIMVVKAPLIEAQLIETTLLNIVSHQTLIATKASRIVLAAGAKTVVEFGLRRAQGPDAGIYGARASIIGGCKGTSNVLAGQMFRIDVKGTHSHSWVMSYPSELEAFEAFASVYPDNCLLLVDTFDTLKSGVPNAIKVFKKLKAAGHKPVGIRLDSGDLAYLSKKARIMLDEAGFKDAIIFASNDIDENLISQLRLQDAKIDVYGVGTKLITSHDMPSLGGVYKLAEIERDGVRYPRMKFSDTTEKITNPGFKTIYRIYEKGSGKAFADLIALCDEQPLVKPLTLTHAVDRWKKTTLNDYEARCLHKQIFARGKCVYNCPPLCDSVNFANVEFGRFWDEYKRLSNPHIYKVNLSDRLYELKIGLLEANK